MSPSWPGPLGKVHTNTIAGTLAPRRPARPAAPRTPSPQLQPRRAALTRSSRSPPATSPPKPRGSRTWLRVPAASGRAAGERDHDAGSPPLRLPRSAPPGCPRRRRARRASWLPCLRAPVSPRAHEPARPRACRFASSAVERGTQLPAEFSRSLPSSPELLTPLTPAFRVKKEA